MEELTILVIIHYLLFLRDIYEGKLSIEKAKKKKKKTETFEKDSFLKNNLALLFIAREKILDGFKSIISKKK